MTTPILGIQEIAGNQQNQYITANEAFRALEAASNDFFSVDLSGGDATLTSAQFTAAYAFLATGHSVARVLTVPASKRAFVVINEGTGNVSVTRGGNSIVLEPGDTSMLLTDGSPDGIYGISGGDGGAATWGAITGTLSDQADLQAALNAKANVSALGSAAAANMITSQTDTTAGRVLDNSGWMGYGISILLSATDDLLALPALPTGGNAKYVWGNASPINSPVAAACYMTREYNSANDEKLLVHQRGNSKEWSRTKASGVWGGWVEVWTTDNLVKTSSATDTTSGRMLKVGDFEIGTLSTTTITDANTATFNITRRTTSSTANIPVSGNGTLIHNQGFAGNYSTQMFINANGDSAHVRGMAGGIWQGWYKFWTTGNTSANVQTMLAAADNAAIRTAIDSSVFPAYIVSTVPAAAANTNKGIIVTNAGGVGRRPFWSNGTDWRDSQNVILS